MYLRLFLLLSTLGPKGVESVRCEAKPWPLVMGTTDANLHLYCLAFDSSPASIFASGYSDSATLVGTADQRRGVVLQLDTSPTILKAWYRSKNRTSYYSCAARGTNVAFIEEYGRALLSTDFLTTYSYTNIFEFSSITEGDDAYKTERTEAIIDSDGYLYYLLFP